MLQVLRCNIKIQLDGQIARLLKKRYQHEEFNEGCKRTDSNMAIIIIKEGEANAILLIISAIRSK